MIKLQWMVGAAALALAASAAPAWAQDGGAAALVAQGVPARAASDAACPRVIALRGAESFPKSGEAYRATLGGLARDCANLGAETLLKVGVTGAGKRSSASGPSWFNAPLAIAVVDDRGQTVASQSRKLRIEIARGKTEEPFAQVIEDLSLPPAPSYAGWTVVVGFQTSAANLAQAAKVMTAGR